MTKYYVAVVTNPLGEFSLAPLGALPIAKKSSSWKDDYVCSVDDYEVNQPFLMFGQEIEILGESL